MNFSVRYGVIVIKEHWENILYEIYAEKMKKGLIKMAKIEYYQAVKEFEKDEKLMERRNIINKIMLYKGELYMKVWTKQVKKNISPLDAFTIFNATPHENFDNLVLTLPTDILIIDRGKAYVEAYRKTDEGLAVLEDVVSADAD